MTHRCKVCDTVEDFLDAWDRYETGTRAIVGMIEDYKKNGKPYCKRRKSGPLRKVQRDS